MDKYLVELIGTFFLVLTIGLAGGLGHAGEMAPLAVGGVLMAMIFAGGHVSAAHYNPAITLAFWMRGRCKSSDVAGYIVGQVLGTALAALAVGALAGEASPAPASFETVPLLVVEVIFTFGLCWVILNVATARGTEGNGFYGLAIGIFVIGGAYTVGPISGAVFNPAVALGLCMMEIVPWTLLGAYVVTEVLGVVLAGLAFRWLVRE